VSNQKELYEALIGHKNTDFYMVYFQRAEERGYTPMSWNWPAFLAGQIWLIYRRNYLWAARYFGITFLISIVSVYIFGGAEAENSRAVLFTSILLFQNVYFPLHANGIYYRWAKREVEKAKALFPNQLEKQKEHLSTKGGANANVIFMVISLFFILSSILNSMQAPQG